MVDVRALLLLGNAAVVAPAGHGKTEVIAQAAALGGRSLILTHTHAGVHAIRARLKRMRVPTSQVAVDTIAGWCTRYAYAFPGVAQPPDGEPQNNSEWEQLYRGTTQAIQVGAIRQVVAASYDRILVDEYQDCNGLQHGLIRALSSIVPTTIFGDPMQGIFEFAGATLDWNTDIYPHFPLAGTLDVPHRWSGKNPALGQWIAETRQRLLLRQPIDLQDPRINGRSSDNAFDMALLFDGMEGREGSFAAIHCNKGICYRLASAANGGYQAIEEVAAKTLMDFAREWDASADPRGKFQSLRTLTDACFHKITPVPGMPPDPADEVIRFALQDTARGLSQGNGAVAAMKFISLARSRPAWKMYRSGLWRDAENACNELATERTESMVEAANRIKQRTSNIGRRLPTRTVSTPLLLKGLEFDHVVIPDATHFLSERQAQAKLFYVAISRATQSLTIGSSSRVLNF